jgi:adenine phosphoribosyltransferase
MNDTDPGRYVTSPAANPAGEPAVSQVTSRDQRSAGSSVDSEIGEVVRAHVRDVPDYPKPGIVFKDITPLLADKDAFGRVIEALAAPWRDHPVDKVVGIEARGFILAAPVAFALGVGLVPVRKHGKLPGTTRAQTYDLEYSTETLEVHLDALSAGERVLVIDDVLATGGTIEATTRLAYASGADVVGISVLLELSFLNPRERLRDLPLRSLLVV